MEQNRELELYKLVTEEKFECGWTGEDQFLIWIPFYQLEDFCKRLSNIFGNHIFDEGGLECRLMQEDVCLDLMPLDGDDVDFKNVFPQEEFKH